MVENVPISITFKPSSHNFTDPIRLFKANDPYYWEIDNMALKELIENDRFLLDQFQNIQVDLSGINREDFSELRPFVAGTDNVVRVRKGRYTGRVNDVYQKSPLEILTLLGGKNIGEVESYSVSDATTLLNTLISNLAAEALDLNGLEIMGQGWSIADEDTGYSLHSVSGGNAYQSVSNENIDPLIEGYNLASGMASQISTFFGQGLFSRTQRLANAWVRRWRGVARTSVVDIQDEITIDVPVFDTSDFYYYNNKGNKIQLPSPTTRIDLVFIYTHPIDSSATHIKKYTAGSTTPQSITKPVLGIVKGAGLGFGARNNSNIPTIKDDNMIDADGNINIYHQIANENSTANGFQGLSVHGTFPSPDDLMNLAPNLINTLEGDDNQFIGQSILPVAYIVVKNTASTNSAGNPILTSADVIDIRPFFRTTELAYNERAGIAAAIPQLSFANPAVGQVQADQQMKEMKAYIDNALNVEPTISGPIVVGEGVVYGGTLYGPERAIESLLGGAANDLVIDGVSQYPSVPDWDLAPWALQQSNPGSEQNDWAEIQYRNSVPNFTSFTNNSSFLRGNFIFCKKRISINTSPSWMSSYDVAVQYQNCVPITSDILFGGNTTVAKMQGLWIERHATYFIIGVAWAVIEPLAVGPLSHRSNKGINGFMGFMHGATATVNTVNASDFESCTYPTIKYQVIGIPSGYSIENSPSGGGAIVLS